MEAAYARAGEAHGIVDSKGKKTVQRQKLSLEF